MNFILQQIAPDTERFENTKEQERQQWLKDLGEWEYWILIQAFKDTLFSHFENTMNTFEISIVWTYM